jgi:ribosomal protein L11 methyltransferase
LVAGTNSKIGQMSDYVEVRVRTAADSSELTSLLQDHGILGSWERDGFLFLYWKSESWNPAALDAIREALRSLGYDAEETAVTVLADRNWNARWLETIQPVRIGRRVRIRQSWSSPDSGFTGIELVIDPEQAFGSGYHETTQLLAEWLEDGIRGRERVLDLGTGSGILAMVALRAGAGFALGLDIDPVAIECAWKNAQANGFGPELDLRTGTPEALDVPSFELIVANLDRRTLLATAPAFPRLSQPGATILLSGLLVDDCEEIGQAFQVLGFELTGRRVKGEWAALVLRFGSSK